MPSPICSTFDASAPAGITAAAASSVCWARMLLIVSFVTAFTLASTPAHTAEMIIRLNISFAIFIIFVSQCCSIPPEADGLTAKRGK